MVKYGFLAVLLVLPFVIAFACLPAAVAGLDAIPRIAPGSVSITGIPAGATVIADGGAIGTTPLSTSTLAAGQHTIVIRLSGYADYTTSVTVQPGTTVTVAYTLIPSRTASPVRLSTVPVPLVTGTSTPAPVRVQTPVPKFNLSTIPVPSATFTPGPMVTTFRPPSSAINLTNPVTSVNVCRIDTGTGQCGGICPVTGQSCRIVNQSACGRDSGSPTTCGCVDTSSHLSAASAGLVHASVTAHYAYPSPPASSRTGVIGAITGFFAKMVDTVEQKPSLDSADPRGFTLASSREMARPREDFCLDTSIPTVLAIIDTKGAFVNTEAGSQKEWFSWDSADPRVRSAIWQVSIFPFPVSRSNWSEVPGLLADGNLAGNEHQFAIDFSTNVPTSGDVARIWGDRKAFLVMQQGILARYKDLLTTGAATQGAYGTPGPSGIQQQEAEVQHQIANTDAALSRISTRLSEPPVYTLRPGAAAQPVIAHATVMENGSGVVKGAFVQPGSVAESGSTLPSAGNVRIPELTAPELSKDKLAGTLPQLQRTFYVRVVPFDANGNYTGNPSNEQVVVIGEPVTGLTGPWSGWKAFPAIDQSGFADPPQPVSFRDRTYLFNVGSDHLVYMNSVDENGAVSGWAPLPGSVRTSEKPSAVAYPFVGPGQSANSQWLYVFATDQDTQTIWYTKISPSGAADSAWSEVPHQNVPYVQHFASPVASADYDHLYLLLDKGSYSLVMTGQGSNGDWSAKPNAEVWPWGSGLSFSYINNPADTGLNNLVGYAKFNSAYEGNVGYFILSSNPVGLSHANDPMSSHSIRQMGDSIYIPSDIVDGVPGFADVAAARFHDRQYFFVRGKQNHIYVAWKPLTPILFGSEPGGLQGWFELSPGSTAANPGISSLVSVDSDRLAVMAHGVSDPSTGTSMPVSTNSLGGTPDSVRLLESVSGTRTLNPSDVQHTFYTEQNVNISWDRTDPFWFAWSSPGSDLISAEYQVSLTPFDEARPVLDAPGIVTSGPLDINASGPDYGSNAAGDFQNAFPSYIAHAHVFPINFRDFATKADTANPSVTRYFLRVVTVAPSDTPGRYLATASDQTEVDWSPPSKVTIYSCTPPQYTYYDYQVPSVKITGFTPIHQGSSDAYCHGVVTTGHSWWAARFGDATASMMVGSHETGEKWYLCNPPDSHWYSFITDLFGLIWNFFEEIIDGVSTTWNTVKAAVISGVCGGNSDCETVVSAGVDAALAAEGIPPTLPNFDEVMHDGIGYIAATVSDESGIPYSDVVASNALGGLYDSMKNVPNPDDPYGIQPDPDYQYQPARLEIVLSNNGPDPTPPGSFTFSDEAGLFKTEQPDTPFPSIPPGQTIQFPLILREDQWKGTSCTECFSGSQQCWQESCDQEFYGQVNQAWFDQYVTWSSIGDTFTLSYAGLSPKMTQNLTEQMDARDGVSFNTYAATGNWDFKAPDCMSQKYGLIFRAHDSDGSVLWNSYLGGNQNRLAIYASDPWSS